MMWIVILLEKKLYLLFFNSYSKWSKFTSMTRLSCRNLPPFLFFNSRNTCAPFLLLEHIPNRAAVINMATWDNDTLHFLTIRYNAVQDIKPLWKLFRQSRFESEGRFPLNSRAFQTSATGFTSYQSFFLSYPSPRLLWRHKHWSYAALPLSDCSARCSTAVSVHLNLSTVVIIRPAWFSWRYWKGWRSIRSPK